MFRFLPLLTLAVLYAQDTRQIVEPKYPPVCEALTARYAAPGGVLSDAAERAPDTDRIQHAIDTCAAGKAVELKPDGDRNIFLAGPLQLKPGVTVIVDARTAIFASRNPREYDVQPGSCGIVGDRGQGCKPLITADRAPGSGAFWSIQRAIDMAPPEGVVINVAPGTYREVLTITKPNITIRSPYKDATKTVIVFNRSAGDSGGTFNSATVNVRAPNFTAENVTFANDWNKTHQQAPTGSQALALSLTADRAVLRNVRLVGNQDTLYAAGGRQYYADCYIEGNVDFIFGDANAVFERCRIHSTPHQIGYITAQGKREASQDSTYVFNQCKLTAEPGVENVWLGRPWRSYASVVFLNTEMGAHIAPAGWREWHPGETKYMETVFYAEYNSTGPGAHANERDPHMKTLTKDEAARYETQRFLAGKDGWSPK
jgi:pectin methylesterase-like acyl-CoA thioesterase